jgi:hypothetical protein
LHQKTVSFGFGKKDPIGPIKHVGKHAPAPTSYFLKRLFDKDVEHTGSAKRLKKNILGVDGTRIN